MLTIALYNEDNEFIENLDAKSITINSDGSCIITREMVKTGFTAKFPELITIPASPNAKTIYFS